MRAILGLIRLVVLLILTTGPVGAAGESPMTAEERAKLGECVITRESRCVLDVLAGRTIERGYLPFGEGEGLRLRHYVLSVAIQVRDGDMALKLAEELTPWANPATTLGRDILAMAGQAAFLYGRDGAVGLRLMQRDATADEMSALESLGGQALEGGYPVRLVAQALARAFAALSAQSAQGAVVAALFAEAADGRWPDAATLAAGLRSDDSVPRLGAQMMLRLMAAGGEGERITPFLPLLPLSDLGLQEEIESGAVFRPGQVALPDWAQRDEFPRSRAVHLVLARLFQERMNKPQLARRQELDRVVFALAELPTRFKAPWTQFYADVELHTLLAMLEQAGGLYVRDRLLRETETLFDLPIERKLFLFAYAPQLLQNPTLVAALDSDRAAAARLAIAAFRGARQEVDGLLARLHWSPLTVSALIEIAYLFGFDAPDL